MDGNDYGETKNTTVAEDILLSSTETSCVPTPAPSTVDTVVLTPSHTPSVGAETIKDPGDNKQGDEVPIPDLPPHLRRRFSVLIKKGMTSAQGLEEVMKGRQATELVAKSEMQEGLQVSDWAPGGRNPG
ncbi:hypothetical protein LTS10_003662 [Elasticomyces elasticus]|nr:hypothetical protein LTS10_003662 [Elasticomyces elasticus]